MTGVQTCALPIYEIESKVTHVISDNASNMRKAFSTMLPTSDEEMDEDCAVDNEDVW